MTEQKCFCTLHQGTQQVSSPPVHLKIDLTSVGVVDPRDSANPPHPHSLQEEKPGKRGPEDVQGRQAGYQCRTETSLYVEQTGTRENCPQPRGQCVDLSCVVVADHLSRGGHGKLEWKRLPSRLPCGSEATFSPGAAELPRRDRASMTRGSQEKRRGAGKHIMGTEGCSSCCPLQDLYWRSTHATQGSPPGPTGTSGP